MYVRDGISYKRRKDLEGLIETLCIEIKYSNRSILLTSVYRPPNNDSDSIQHWLSNMEESMYKIYSENKPTILMGDINIDIMSDKKDKLQESWISLTTNIQLNQIIKEPTRVTNTSETQTTFTFLMIFPFYIALLLSIVLAIISLYLLFLKWRILIITKMMVAIKPDVSKIQ